MFCKVIKKQTVNKSPVDVYDISVENHHNFLLENGAVVHNCDTFQSADLLQQLSGKGIDTSIISVDRVKDGLCLPYQYLKSTIYEERLALFENNLLTEELLGLERNNANGRIDHSPSSINSKDSADALCGAIWNASQHGEEFNFEFGETLDTIVDVSSESSEDNMKKQLVVSFEDELKRASDAFGQGLKDNKSAYTDFGLGPSTTEYALFDDCLII